MDIMCFGLHPYDLRWQALLLTLLDTKISVYVAVILTILIYGCETQTLYRHNIRKLDQFHMRCLRRIAHIHWKDKVPNTKVLERSVT